MNAKSIVALKAIAEGLNDLILSFEQEETTEVIEAPKKRGNTAVTPKNSKKIATPEPEEVEDEEDKVQYTEKSLGNLTYNNLKKLAKELGVSAVGSREEITTRILQGDTVTEDVEVTEEPTPEKKPSAKTTKKGALLKKSEPEPEEEEEEEDPIVAQVMKEVEDMDNESLADLLTSVGMRAKGKRQALIASVIEAVKEGLINLDDDYEDEEEPSQTTATESEDFDINDTDNPEMTDLRRAAIESYVAETEEMFEDKDVTRAQLIEWLQEYHNTDDKMKKKSDAELLQEYTYYSCLLIDDDGQFVEEGAYTVNSIPYAYGKELNWDEENEVYVCTVTGETYEAGE